MPDTDEKTNPYDLPPKQFRALVALLEESTIEGAAEASGVDPSSLHRWMKDETFEAAYKEAKRRLFDHAIGRIQQCASKAVDTLEEILGDVTAKDSARVTAARIVLDFARSGISLVELEQEIDLLKQQVSQRMES